MENTNSYSLGGEIASLAIRNNFTETVNRACKHLGGALQPFCFCATEVQSKNNVLDLSLSTGLDSKDTTLFEEVVKNRLSSIMGLGSFESLSAKTRKALFIDYLLCCSVCYIEMPKYTSKGGIVQHSYDKFLVTKNLRLMSQWTGDSIADIQYKYRDRLSATPLDYSVGELRYAKLNSSAKGTSISLARTPLSVDKLICVPLFALNAFTRGIEPHLQEGIVEFTFLKDNDMERTLPTTLSHEIMMKYYKDSEYVNRAYSKVAFFDQELGGMKLSSKQNRGYIQLPELGCSKYDANGTRSINVARILRVRKLEEVDSSFIDVDLNLVMNEFDKALRDLYVHDQASIKPLVESLIGEPLQDSMSPSGICERATSWVNDQNLVLTTTFRRHLHKFMLSNPQWFKGYTGKPLQSSITSGSLAPSFNFGV